MPPLTTKELMQKAHEIWETDEAICNATGLSRTTLWRMGKGCFNFHARNIGKLYNAILVHEALNG